MTEEDIQEVVEEVDKLLQRALKQGNRYTSHKEVRPSAIHGFDLVEEARQKLDEIDERDFTDG
jgi:hypothetical protein